MNQPSQPVYTDLKIVLRHLDDLFCQMHHCLNAVSEQLLAMTAAIECLTLSQKLQRTLLRWQVYLPFHEANDVNFKTWIAHLSHVHKTLNSPVTDGKDGPEASYYPDAPFCLDFAELLDGLDQTADNEDENVIQESEESLPVYAPRYADTEMETDVREYVERIEEQVERIRSLSDDEEQELRSHIDHKAMSMLRRQYADYLRFVCISRNQLTAHQVEQSVLPKVRSYLNAVVEQPIMAYCLDMALSTLIDTLRQIDEMICSDISDKQFLRLSLRLYYRHCPDALSAAEKDVHRWKTEWPGRRRKERALQKRTQLIATLRENFSEPFLDDYIDTEHPSPLTDAEFGRYLFAMRHQLSIEEVKNLFRDCFRIQELNRLIDPMGIEADINATMLTQERKQIYNRLCELIRQAEWQGGMTAERVHQCVAQLLITQPSDTFWKLLTNRRNCEDDYRSLKLTWLNLVGYFRSRGFLKGGSLTLCRYFFPDGTPDSKNNSVDHNAVNKGAGDRAGNDFHDLITILDQELS